MTTLPPASVLSDPAALRGLWRFKPGVTYLNHGSFGACPTPVLEAAFEWARRLAAEPCEFFQRHSPDLLAEVRARLGRFLGASPADLVQMTNATVAGNVFAHAFPLRPGDEVLATDHEYGAMIRMWETLCRRAGARLVQAELPWPVTTADALVEALFAARTERTRLVLVSHVTSPTALVLPVAAIVARARALGLPVMVDAAHAPGMFPVNLDALGAECTVGNCHKWMCAPVGSGFLHLTPAARRMLGGPPPQVIGWGERPSRGREPGLWQAEFEWGGTRDYSAFLATATAIDLLEAIGWERIRFHAREVIAHARRRIPEVTGLAPAVPDDPDLCGAMVSLPLPAGDRAGLQNALWHRFAIEVPVVEWKGRRLLRVSAHLYNTPDDVDRLAQALPAVLSTE